MDLNIDSHFSTHYAQIQCKLGSDNNGTCLRLFWCWFEYIEIHLFYIQVKTCWFT